MEYSFKKFYIMDVLGGIEKDLLWKTTDISNSELKSISEELDSSFRNLFYLYFPFHVHLVYLKGSFNVPKNKSPCDFFKSIVRA